jgi:CheY-like chemotaxis protein
MSELLDSLLDISKLEAGATKPQITDVDLDELFEGLAVEFAEIATAKRLHFEMSGNNETARTDPKLLGQVVRNLLSNAFKFTHEGFVRMQCVREAGHLRVDVTDTGQGIAPEHMPHIFDDFYQAGGIPNTPCEGHGLGLGIVHRLIQLLGHQIKVNSTVGEGSNFSIVLPVGSTRSRVKPPTQASSQEIRIDQAHVMVVEDDASVLNGIRRLLEAAGYRVSGVASVGEAVEQAHKQKDILLLITDFHLGNGELGTEVIRSIRSVLGRDVKAFLLTGDTSSRVQIIARENDACLMSKPINADELLGLLSRS